MNLRKIVLPLVSAACLIAPPAIAQADGPATSLTIYSTAQPGAVPPELYRPTLGQQAYNPGYFAAIPGYAIVREVRPMPLDEARSTVRFTDVAALIDPTTVSFLSLSDPDGTRVLEQNFEFDLVSNAKLLEKFIDHEITVEQIQGDKVATLTGKLLSSAGGVVLQTADGGVQIISHYANVLFPSLPGGLITRPTLVWDVRTEKPGPHDVRVSYETKGITWWADYNIIFTPGADANRGVLDVGAWVSILNQSGAGYADARLKLIAGDVHRAPQPQMPMAMARRSRMAETAMMDAGFEEKSFFEYHLYTLGRPTTLPDRSTKQIELFPAVHEVPCEKVLVYYGQDRGSIWMRPDPAVDRNFGVQSNKKVDIYLRFKNEEKIGMGMPLPSGRIRVSQRDTADDSLEFIGEDTIDHTPKNEEVLIRLGSAFDVVGERTQLDFKVDSSRKWMQETIEIKVRNHKNEPVKVLVKENLFRWINWRITASTHEQEKLDARTIHFPIEVPAEGEVVVRYTVDYTW